MKLFLHINAKKIETVISYFDNYLWKVGIQKTPNSKYSYLILVSQENIRIIYTNICYVACHTYLVFNTLITTNCVLDANKKQA
mgnify:CR=1 FL=1